MGYEMINENMPVNWQLFALRITYSNCSQKWSFTCSACHRNWIYEAKGSNFQFTNQKCKTWVLVRQNMHTVTAIFFFANVRLTEIELNMYSRTWRPTTSRPNSPFNSSTSANRFIDSPVYNRFWFENRHISVSSIHSFYIWIIWCRPIWMWHIQSL